MILCAVRCDDFVGRREELTFLSEEYAAACEGRTRFVSIEGEAGIGKSRLVAEFLSLVDGQASVATGQCSEHVRSPYLPFAAILEQVDARGLAALKPRERGSGEKKAAFFEATADVFVRESRRRPIVAVIEDVQWADSATAELLLYLVANLREARVLIVPVTRTEPVAESGIVAALRASVVRNRANVLRLHGLSRNEVRHLVQRIAADNRATLLPEALSQIEVLAEGNPLFVEELVRIALESGSLNVAANVPLSIQAMLSERLEPLCEDDRSLLVRAAIVGQRFEAPFLATIVERPTYEILETLQRAAEAGIVVPSSVSPHEFTFRHALIRQALEDRLILGLAAPLHVRIAQQLEALPDADERVAELAFHWSAARVPERARECNERAAEAAAAVYAYRDAIGFYSMALRWEYPPGRARAAIYEKLGTLLYVDGCGEEPAAWFERCREEYASLGDDEGAAHALLLLADQYWVDARTGESLDAAREAARILENLDRPAMSAAAQICLARFSVTLGSARDAWRHLDAAERLKEHFDAELLASFHEVRAETHAALGELAPALEDCRLASELAHRTGDSDLIAQVENNCALVACDLGEVALAISRHKVALAEAHRTSRTWRVAYSALNYAMTLVLAGDARGARDLVRVALESGVATATLRTRAASVGIPLALVLDDRQLLRACSLEAALEHAHASGEVQRVGSVGAAFVELRAAQGDAASARALLSDTLARVSHVHRCWSLPVQAALHGSAVDRERAWSALRASTGRPRLLRAHRMLFNAMARARDPVRAARMAALSERAFASLGLQQYAALARGAQEPAKRVGGLQLSARQMQIARLVAGGATNKVIAARLHISENTVEHHLSGAFARLGIHSRSQLAAKIGEEVRDGAGMAEIRDTRGGIKPL